jgi:hypothetical protein
MMRRTSEALRGVCRATWGFDRASDRPKVKLEVLPAKVIYGESG